MPTVNTVTVKSSAGDYTSLASAEAGEQADLVAGDVQLDIECYSMADTAVVYVSGWTTDATRYLRIFTPTAERHDGKWNTGKYRLAVAGAGAFDRALYIQEDYVRVEGLQVENSDADGACSVRIDNTAAAASSDVRLTSCLIRKGGSASAGDAVRAWSGKTTIRNSVIFDADKAGVDLLFSANAPTVVMDNVTIANCATYGVNNSENRTCTLQNVYSGGNGTDDYNGTITRTTCMHSSATSFSGSTASTAHSTANFTNVTVGSEDYHLVTGSALIDAGTDLSGTFTDDIDGVARTGTWDVGADEYVSAGGALAGPLVEISRLLCGLIGGRLVK